MKIWHMPEAVFLEAVDADRDLRAGGAADWQIWEKLDTWLDVDGEPLPAGSTILDYLKSRMSFIDHDLKTLDDRLVSGQVEMCHRWLDQTKPLGGEGWPPVEWLTKRLSFAEFETLESGADQSDLGAPAMLHLGRSNRDLAQMKIRMLAGDEIWSFSSPAEYWRHLGGRAGVALVRNGRLVAHVVTDMN